MEQINKNTQTYNLFYNSYSMTFKKLAYRTFSPQRDFLNITARASVQIAIKLNYVKKLGKGHYVFTKAINEEAIDKIYRETLNHAREMTLKRNIRISESKQNSKDISTTLTSFYNQQDFSIQQCIDKIKAAGGKVMMPTTEYKEV